MFLCRLISQIRFDFDKLCLFLCPTDWKCTNREYRHPWYSTGNKNGKVDGRKCPAHLQLQLKLVRRRRCSVGGGRDWVRTGARRPGRHRLHIYIYIVCILTNVSRLYLQERRLAVCRSWPNAYWTCTPCTSWSSREAESWRWSPKNYGRRSSGDSGCHRP